MDVEEGMRALAERGHAGQLRKDGRTPYIEHPRAVVALLRSWRVADGETLAVAWGHDLLEDTAVTEDEILAAAGPRHGAEVLACIRTLTRDKAVWPVKRDWLDALARTAGPRPILVKCADRICNTRDFIPLAGPVRARSYLADGEAVFAAAHDSEVNRDLEALRKELDELEAGEIEKQRLEEAQREPAVDMWELRDAWISDYYVVKDPPIAYGYVFEGCLAYDGGDFCTGFTMEEHRALWKKVSQQVPRYVAEAYGDGDICPEEIDWREDTKIEWPRPPRTCTPDKPCWGSSHCRVGKKTRSMDEIARLVRSLANNATNEQSSTDGGGPPSSASKDKSNKGESK